MEKNIVVLDFYMNGCAPCMQMMAVMDDLAAEFGDKITVRKINVEESPALAAHYEIMSVPTIIIKVDGEIVHRGHGIHSLNLLRRKVSEHIQERA
jgi:thioredoxin 1